MDVLCECQTDISAFSFTGNVSKSLFILANPFQH